MPQNGVIWGFAALRRPQRDPAEVEKIRGERAAMQQARQMAEMAQQGGDAMKSLGEGTQALSEAGGEGAEVTDIAEAA